MNYEVLINGIFAMEGAIFSLIFIVVYILILEYMRRKHYALLILVERTINIILAFAAWLVVIMEQVNSVEELFDSHLFYYIAITIAAVAIAHNYIDFIDNKNVRE